MRIALALLALLLLVPAGAHAASVAYVDNGEVWLSSLDGAQKVRLASPVVNAEGNTEKWLAVAASDSGRIVAARNVPGRIARFSWFKVWEPDGSSTVEGPLNAPGGWAVYVYPLGFDLTADGKHMVYGYSNSGFCCPISFARGTYVRPVTNSPLDPINLPGEEDPTIFGTRVISHVGTTINTQDPSSTYSTSFNGWLDVSGVGLDVRRTDMAANGALTALELEQWQGGSQTVGKIALLSTQGAGQPLPGGPVDCFIDAAGIARDASLSQDARHVAWSDAGGLKVAGTPTTATDPCVPTSAPVVLSPTGTSASIGGADIAAFLPPAPVVDGGGGGGAGAGSGGGAGGGGGGGSPATGSGTPATTSAPAAARPQLLATLAYNFNAGRTSTRFLSLAVRNVESGATVAVKCPKGCTKKTYTKRNVSGSLSLKSLVRKPLKVGATITVTVSRPGSKSVTKILKVRARRAPLVTTKLG